MGRLGGDDADLVVAGGRDGSADRGTDDLDDGDVIALAGVVQGRGRGGVAGDDQSLDPAVDQPVEAFQGVLADLGDGARTVGRPGGVTEETGVRFGIDGPRSYARTRGGLTDRDL